MRIFLFVCQIPILSEVLDTALSKVQWSPNGQLLAVGDVEGTIYIYEAGEVSTVGSTIAFFTY